MGKTATVTVERRLAAPPERVFDAWVDADEAGRWLFRTPGGRLERCEIEARVDGGFTVAERRGEELAEHFGEYVEFARPDRLTFDFWTSFSDERTRVTIRIVSDGEGSLLRLTHHGVWSDYEQRTHEGWTTILAGLAQTVERD